jgi:AraC-like DNA-binding protein
MFSGASHAPMMRLPTHLPVSANGQGIWREVLGRTVMRMGVEPFGGVRLDAVLTVGALPGLRIVFGEVTPARVSRERDDLVADGNDDLGLMINTGGSFVASSMGREITLGPGEAHLISAAEPFSTTWTTRGGVLGLRVPRAVLAAALPNVEDAIMRPIPRQSLPLRLLTRYASFIAGEAALSTPQLRHTAVAHLHDLIILTLGGGGDDAGFARERGLAGARFRAIQADIIDNLARGDLGVETVAARYRMSARQLQRLFEHHGTTFTAFVLGQRLKRAHRMLSDPRLAGKNIATLAYDAGFGDVSYFNHAFRRHFGATPSEVRAATLADV